jgi:hypothetical protein
MAVVFGSVLGVLYCLLGILATKKKEMKLEVVQLLNRGILTGAG